MSEQAIKKHQELMAKRELITLEELNHAWNLLGCRIKVHADNKAISVLGYDIYGINMYRIEIELVEVLKNIKYEHFDVIKLTRKFLQQEVQK